MRKITFYPKLALGNLVRNRSTYLPYLFACVISVFTFYSLASISDNQDVLSMRGSEYIQIFTSIGLVVLGIFCTILLFYTNSFLIKRRKKELGLYSILGMEKKNIGILMFFETLFISVAAIIIGLILGVVLSRLVFLLLLRLMLYPVNINMPVSINAIGGTSVLFVAIFFLTLIVNLMQVRVASPLQLMAGSKEGEKEPKVSWVLTIGGLLSLGAGYYLALAVKDSVLAIMVFFLAALLVIIGTYCLFTSGSVAVLKLLRKNKKYYYNPKNFMPVSGLIYRMKQNAAGLATICILSCMVLVTVSTSVALYTGAEDALLTNYPYDFSMMTRDKDTAKTISETVKQTLAEQNAKTSIYREYPMASSLAIREGDKYTVELVYDMVPLNDRVMINFVRLEDYNRLENTNLKLQPGQVGLYYSAGNYGEKTINSNGIKYDVVPIETWENKKTVTGIMNYIILVFPDEQSFAEAVRLAYPQGEQEKMEYFNFEFNLEGTEQQSDEFYNALTKNIPEDLQVRVSYRNAMRIEWYSLNGGFLFLGVFFGILFILAAAMIIYYKQISEGYDDRERFIILQKVGMSAKEVKSTIGKQIRLVFFLPLVTSFVHVGVATVLVNRVMVEFGIVNPWSLIFATAATAVAYALVYFLVYSRTAKSYFKIVKFEN